VGLSVPTVAIYVPWLADAARATGYPVIEVAGWRTRGHGGMRVVEGAVGHHTATSAAAKGDYPSLNIVTNGRADLAGPLCNYGLGRSGTIYVVAAGLAYHAGASRYGGFSDLNDEFLGIEAESPGDGAWTPQQRDAYPKLVGQILLHIRRDASRYCSHRTCATPAGRKPDPTGIADDWMQNTARAYMASGGASPNLEPDLDARQAAQLDTVLAQLTGNAEPWNFSTPWPTWDGGTNEKFTLVDYLRRNNVEVRQAWNAVKALDAKLDKLQSGGQIPGSLSDADVQRIATAVADIMSKRMQS
jgi:hypothetical protein